MGSVRQRFFSRPSFWVALVVATHGFYIIIDTLFGQFGVRDLPRHLFHPIIIIDIPLLLGLLLIYLSLSLNRRKRTAWLMASALYVFLLGLTVGDVLTTLHTSPLHFRPLEIVLALLMLGVLWLTRSDFVVRSDTRTFTNSVRVAAAVFVTALLYGSIGYMLMDTRDFRVEISPIDAVHYTIDQFDLTTNPLTAHTRRAALFQDSLTFISVAAFGFVVVSLFQPLRARIGHHKDEADLAKRLVYEHQADSEDYFKLWPHDKTYLFTPRQKAMLAYRVQSGVALAVGDPVGENVPTKRLLRDFEEMCYVNDWRPAFIHTTPRWSTRLEAGGYQLQLIGQEAIVDVPNFIANVKGTKYFREISNRFAKLDYSTELLQPPHHQAILERLKVISDEWLTLPGRVERGYMMGYFNEAYLQQCQLFVARDAAGTIQAFMNIVPSPMPEEANYDLLRSGTNAQGNINDYLLTELLVSLHEHHIERLNMGLSPLTGIEDEPNTLINRTLRFVYSSGDRFYSFRGLHRFKAKYQPDWSDRFVAYKGNASDFLRVIRALGKAMQV